MWNAQPEQQQQSSIRFQDDAQPRAPTPYDRHTKCRSLLRSPTPEITTNHPSRSPTPKPKQSQNGRSSPFRDILRSASKLSRSLLSTPRRTASRLSRSASRARNGSTDDEDDKSVEENKADDAACWSDDGAELPVTEKLADGHKTSSRRGSVSRAWGSLRHRSRYGVGGGGRRGESESPPKARGERAAEPGSTWQREYQRTSDRQTVGEDQKRRPRPQSYPCFNEPRAFARPGYAHGHDDGEEMTARGGGGGEPPPPDVLSEYLEGDRSISRINGLLDIWDAQDNPTWEEEAFTLCDLRRCRRCGRFYAPMKTVRHRCRNST